MCGTDERPMNYRVSCKSAPISMLVKPLIQTLFRDSRNENGKDFEKRPGSAHWRVAKQTPTKSAEVCFGPQLSAPKIISPFAHLPASTASGCFTTYPLSPLCSRNINAYFHRFHAASTRHAISPHPLTISTGKRTRVATEACLQSLIIRIRRIKMDTKLLSDVGPICASKCVLSRCALFCDTSTGCGDNMSFRYDISLSLATTRQD